MSHTHQHTRTRVRLGISLRDGDEMQCGTLMTQGGVQTKGNVSTRMMAASHNRTQSVVCFFVYNHEPREANKAIVLVHEIACMHPV